MLQDQISISNDDSGCMKKKIGLKYVKYYRKFSEKVFEIFQTGDNSLLNEGVVVVET